MCADARTAREVPRETSTSHVCSRRRPGNAASRSAQHRSEPCCYRPLISSSIQLPVCYLISGTGFAEEIRDAIGRWREQKRLFCSFSLSVSDEKKWNAAREIAWVDVARHIASCRATFLRG